MIEIVREFRSNDGKRMVQIFKRSNGTFGFETLEFSDHPRGMAWIPLRPDSHCFTESADAAEAEARGRVDWLSTDFPKDPQQ